MTHIDELLGRYRATWDERTKVAAELRAAIAKLESQLEDLTFPFSNKLAQIEIEIKSLVHELGKSVKDHGVKVTYRREYIRTSWDSKALIGFAAAHPEINEFKRESVIKASVSIKVVEYSQVQGEQV